MVHYDIMPYSVHISVLTLSRAKQLTVPPTGSGKAPNLSVKRLFGQTLGVMTRGLPLDVLLSIPAIKVYLYATI